MLHLMRNPPLEIIMEAYVVPIHSNLYKISIPTASSLLLETPPRDRTL